VPGAHHRAGDRQGHLRAFFADIVGVTVKLGPGHFAQVQVNESLILDFADAPEPWAGVEHDYDRVTMFCERIRTMAVRDVAVDVLCSGRRGRQGMGSQRSVPPTYVTRAGRKEEVLLASGSNSGGL
jgi:hypothetical protein